MAGQRRLTISRLRVPNLDGAVMAAARNLLSIGAPRHWTDPEIVRSQDTNQQKQRGKTWKNLPTRVPSQRRLAISRSRVPNLDGFVPTATGDLLSIGAPRHWCDPEIKWSQQTNQKKQRGKNLKKNLKIRVPGHRRLGKVNFESFKFLYFQHLFIKKSYVFEWPVSWTLKQEHKICIICVWHID